MQPRNIIRNRDVVTDNYTYITDAAELPASGDIIVDLPLWKEHRASLLNHDGLVGVQVPGDAEPEDIVEDLSKLAVVAINFPSFRDGRGYSLARILRERFGYTGELRATGDILRDQLFFLQRCGFDAFDTRPDRCIQEALKGLSDFTVTYQADVHEKRPIYQRRPV
ncbi:MAG TPA: DUF934 domain-containing protein [Dongiaceae bacterium]|nr:DUF934 domain-containing protein [Dongiaceae bacterium]